MPKSSDDPKPSSPGPMTKEQIQAELKRLKDSGEIPEMVGFMESLMRGLEGKPKGNG